MWDEFKINLVHNELIYNLVFYFTLHIYVQSLKFVHFDFNFMINIAYLNSNLQGKVAR